MSTTDGAIGQKLFYDKDWIHFCLLPKTVIEMKHLPSAKLYSPLLAQIKQHHRYSSLINNLKYE